MFTIYLRSSSISTYKQCPHKFFICYVLGIKFQANEAANVGSISHKCIEMFGRKKIAMQNGEQSFFDSDLNREVNISEVQLDWVVNTIFHYYTVIKPLQTKPFKKTAFGEVYGHVETVLTNQIYSPLNREVIAVEDFFDFEIKQDWAKYDFTIQGKRYEGYLKLRGTMDALYKISDDHWEYWDEKSGRVAYSWEKQREKTYEEFRNDVQLRLYHYVLNLKYPNVKYWTLTLFYSKANEPVSVLFTKDDLPFTEQAIRRNFEEIKATKIPAWIKNDSKSHMCNFCEYAKNNKPGTTDSYCWATRQEILKLGLERVQERGILVESHFTYSGGGSNRTIGE